MTYYNECKFAVRKRYRKSVCHKGLRGWAIYTRRFGARLSGWNRTRLEAWQQAKYGLRSSIS